jgi:hypothetical protein
MYKRPVNGHPHTKETHDEFSKLVFTADIENHIAIALKAGLQILKVFILVSFIGILVNSMFDENTHTLPGLPCQRAF